MNLWTQQGWQCPTCNRIYSPTTPLCFTCPQATVTSHTTPPPKRQWVGLTAAEVFKALEANEQDYNWHGFARDLEAKLKEKNT